MAPGANVVPADGWRTANTEPEIGFDTGGGGVVGPAVAPPGMVVELLDTAVDEVVVPEP